MVDQVRRAAVLTSQLTAEAFRVLSVSAALLPRFMAIPLSSIVRYSSLPEDRVRYAEGVLVREGIWAKERSGYRLTMLGLDTLALHTFVQKKLLSHVGVPIGIGKESDVYEAIDAQGKPVALKLFRIGRISFRSLSRKRTYNAPQGHKWLLSSMNSAISEERVLKVLSRYRVNVPQSRGRAFHALVMDMKLGIPLYRVKKLLDADVILRELLKAIRQIYLQAGLVNSDLSEFNVLVTPNHEIILIDWPQAVAAKGSVGDAALSRDIGNLLKYFKKKFGIICKVSEAISYCKGEVNAVNVSYDRTSRNAKYSTPRVQA